MHLLRHIDINKSKKLLNLFIIPTSLQINKVNESSLKRSFFLEVLLQYSKGFLDLRTNPQSEILLECFFPLATTKKFKEKF